MFVNTIYHIKELSIFDYFCNFSDEFCLLLYGITVCTESVYKLIPDLCFTKIVLFANMWKQGKEILREYMVSFSGRQVAFLENCVQRVVRSGI